MAEGTHDDTPSVVLPESIYNSTRLLDGSTKHLTGILINSRSLKSVNKSRSKLVQFQSLVYLHNPSFVAVTETWLSPDIANEEILDGTYTVFRKDRDGRGGGVLFAVNSTLLSSRRLDLESTSAQNNEIIVCEIITKKSPKLIFVLCYRPPNNDADFLYNFKTVMENISSAGINHTCVLGDFNLPSVNWDTGYPDTTSGLTFDLCEVFLDQGLSQINRFPSTNHGNILDLIACNFPEKISDVNAFNDILETDHAILSFKINYSYGNYKPKPREVF